MNVGVCVLGGLECHEVGGRGGIGLARFKSSLPRLQLLHKPPKEQPLTSRELSNSVDL